MLRARKVAQWITCLPSHLTVLSSVLRTHTAKGEKELSSDIPIHTPWRVCPPSPGTHKVNKSKHKKNKRDAPAP